MGLRSTVLCEEESDGSHTRPVVRTCQIVVCQEGGIHRGNWDSLLSDASVKKERPLSCNIFKSGVQTALGEWCLLLLLAYFVYSQTLCSFMDVGNGNLGAGLTGRLLRYG